jgi:hypothetical protein
MESDLGSALCDILINISKVCLGGVLQVDALTAERYSPYLMYDVTRQEVTGCTRCKHLPQRVQSYMYMLFLFTYIPELAQLC